MKNTLLKILAVAGIIAAQSSFALKAQTVSTFESLKLPITHWDGSSKPLGFNFTSGDAIFHNYYDTSYGGFWASGWAYSNVKDSVTAGSANAYAARAGSGYNSSDNYVVGQNGSVINLKPAASGQPVSGFYVTNSTYTALSMKDGDAFAKKFGGASGDDPDWFKLTVRNWYGGVMTDDSVEFYLADYRDANNANDYIVTDWQWVDLTSLGNVDSLQFGLSSSDAGIYGMNTPGFFCLDDFTAQNVSTFESLNLPVFYWNGLTAPFGSSFKDGNAIFPNYYDTAFGGYWASGWAYSRVQDSVTAGLGNAYAARAGSGYNNSANYAVGQSGAVIYLNAAARGKIVNGFYVTNSTFAALSMKDGDAFAKKFGGASGDDADWFKLTVRNWYNGVLTDDSVEFYLADYRSANNAEDYIVTTWEWVDLTSLGNTDSLQFILSSSDAGMNGMNTPAYFCIDDFTTADIAASAENITNANSPVTVYPNPASGSVNIDLSKFADKNVEIRITDISGRTIYSAKKANTGLVFVDMNEYAGGIYFVTIKGETAAVNAKLLKQ